MIRHETPALEWNERLGTPNGVQIAQVLRHFHQRPLVLRDPIPNIASVTRPLLMSIDAECGGIIPLTLMDVAKGPKLTIDRTFGDIVWDWGNLFARARAAEDGDIDDGDLAAVIKARRPRRMNPLLELTNTAAIMLEERIVKPAFAEIARSLPIGTGLPRIVKHAAYDGFFITLMHLVVLIALGDQENDVPIGAWCDIYLRGNLPIGLTEDNNFLLLTR